MDEPPAQALAGSDASALAIAGLRTRLAQAQADEPLARTTDF
jgi:hypothetical protein